MNEFNEYVRDTFSAAGEIVIRSMMGGYLVYLNGKLIGDICGNELFLKRTPTSDRLLADSELRYPYEESRTLMHVFDRFEDAALVSELLAGMYDELPEPKKKKK
ncbi:MAG: TfoX/Sxy family protein [Firmicutes bacterium]|nr:TfoX/Sxy family protein [Bacillota bacterium]